MLFNSKNKVLESLHPKLINFDNKIRVLIKLFHFINEIYKIYLKILYKINMTI
jgi:hypothetical protein